MEFDNLDFELSEGEKPYNIRHRAFYFAKEVIMFIRQCKYEQCSFRYLTN